MTLRPKVPQKKKPIARRPRFPCDVDLQQLAAKVQAGLPLTIPEWCRKRGISRATYDVLRVTGRGPDVTQAVPFGKVTISAEADGKWEARHTQSSGEPRIVKRAKTGSSRAAA